MGSEVWISIPILLYILSQLFNLNCGIIPTWKISFISLSERRTRDNFNRYYKRVHLYFLTRFVKTISEVNG